MCVRQNSAHLGGFEHVVDNQPDVVRCRQKDDQQSQADLSPEQYPRQRRPDLAQAAEPGKRVSTGAIAQHVSAAAAYERSDVPQLAEEHVANDVAPEPDRHPVLCEQTLVAHHDVVLRELGAKRRSDRHGVAHLS